MKPRARRADLEVQPVDDELVVYDLRSNRAHCLHPMVARVWDLADGTRDVPELLARLHEDGSVELDQDDVWAALDALGDADLLEERAGPPMGERRLSRRDLVRDVAAAGTLSMVPGVVSSILAPTPARAQSAPTGGGEVDEKAGEANQKEIDSKGEQAQKEQDAKEAQAKGGEESDKEQASKEQQSKTAGEEAEKEQASKEQQSKESQSKTAGEEAEKEQQAKLAQEQDAKEAQSKGGEEAEKEQASKEQQSKESQSKTGGGEEAEKEQASKEQASKEQQAKQTQEQRSKEEQAKLAQEQKSKGQQA